jgi:hypothetical protein
MKYEFEIWDKLIESLGFKFEEEFSSMNKINVLKYNNGNSSIRLYFNRDNGKVEELLLKYNSDFLILSKKDFEVKYKEDLRNLKIKLLLDSIS